MTIELQNPPTGSDATYLESGTAVALQVDVVKSVSTGNGATGSEAFNYVISGTTWIAEREFRNIIPSGTTTIIGSIYQLTDPWTTIGSVRQLTDPWIVLGSAQITNTSLTGSINLINPWAGIGSTLITNNLLGSFAITTNPVPISGEKIQIWPSGTFFSTVTQSGNYFGAISGNVINTGSVTITNIPLSIIGSTAITSYNAWAGIGSVKLDSSFFTTSGNDIITGSVAITNVPIGYSTSQIIRKSSGSPPIQYIFSNTSQSLMIDNLGGTPIYFAFDGNTAGTGSTNGFIKGNEFRTLDLIAGSVSVLASGDGTLTPMIQIIKLN